MHLFYKKTWMRNVSEALRKFVVRVLWVSGPVVGHSTSSSDAQRFASTEENFVIQLDGGIDFTFTAGRGVMR